MTILARGAATTLTVEWREYAGGPYATVTDVTITITPILGGAPTLAETATGVLYTATGINAYSWTPDGALAVGDYLAQWAGTDADLETVGASEIVTVVSADEDMLATPEDLASFLQLGAYASLTAAKQATLTMLVALATSKVQRAAGGQRIIAATSTGAVIDLDFHHEDQYVQLPQLPVRSVTSVALNGTAVSDYYVRSHCLWRLSGWAAWAAIPPQLTVTYAHGHLAGSPALQFARSTVLELARGGYGNPAGVTSEAVDDYRVTYAEADARMVLPVPTAQAIRAAYGAGAYVTVSRY